MFSFIKYRAVVMRESEAKIAEHFGRQLAGDEMPERVGDVAPFRAAAFATRNGDLRPGGAASAG
jgi:hypothetical protein